MLKESLCKCLFVCAYVRACVCLLTLDLNVEHEKWKLKRFSCKTDIFGRY